MSKKSLPTNEMNDTPDDFDTIYESNAPLIYRFMFWRTQDEMLAQDLTSNVFEKAWRTRKNFTGGSSKAWLYRIARTTLIDYWRKKKDLAADETVISRVVSDTAALDEALDLSMAIADLRKALSKLPKEMQDVVQLRFINGLSARETATRLAMSEANVRVIQYRALKKLRGYLR
jgi:RNA polymerase sigma-70 factor (ECF subfamily)